MLLFSNLVRTESYVSQLPAEHGWCWACSLLSVAVRQLWPDHITCVWEGALTQGFGGQTWETHPTSATTTLFCAQSHLELFCKVREFLQVLTETV